MKMIGLHRFHSAPGIAFHQFFDGVIQRCGTGGENEVGIPGKYLFHTHIHPVTVICGILRHIDTAGFLRHPGLEHIIRRDAAGFAAQNQNTFAVSLGNLRNDGINHLEFSVHPGNDFRSPVFRAEVAAHHGQSFGDVLHVLHGDAQNRNVDPLHCFHRFVVVGSVDKNAGTEGRQGFQINRTAAHAAGFRQGRIGFFPEIGLYVDGQHPVTQAQSLNKGNGYRVNRGNGSLVRLCRDIQDPSSTVQHLVFAQSGLRRFCGAAGCQAQGKCQRKEQTDQFFHNQPSSANRLSSTVISMGPEPEMVTTSLLNSFTDAPWLVSATTRRGPEELPARPV